MIGFCVSSAVVALEALFLEKLNPVLTQWLTGGETFKSDVALLTGSQSTMTTNYDWVSTLSIALIVLTYILITVLVVILVRRGLMGKNHTSFVGTNEPHSPSVEKGHSDNYTSQRIPLSDIASQANPNIKQWKEVKLQVETSELPHRLQERYLNALAHFDKKRFEEVGHMARRALTESDKRYMICFIVGMSITDIATIFHVEPTSLYTMKYRIKKKFPPELIDYIEFL